MTTIEESPRPQEPDLTDRPDPVAPADRRRRQRALLVGTGLVVLATGGWATLSLFSPGSGHPVPDRVAVAPDAAITLPGTVGGLKPVGAGDPTQSPAWRLQARQAGKGATVVGRYYSSKVAGVRGIRLVAGRTDLTGKLELAWAADAGHPVGRARCTNDIVFVPGSKPRIRPTMMLCWRTTANFSAYSLIIDPRADSPVPETDGTAALDSVWKSAPDALR